MSKTKYYIKTPEQPHLPLIHYVTLWLLLDRLNAPQWLWGIYWCLAVGIFLAYIYYRVTVDAKEVDIQNLLKSEHEKNETFKELKEKLEEYLRKQAK